MRTQQKAFETLNEIDRDDKKATRQAEGEREIERGKEKEEGGGSLASH